MTALSVSIASCVSSCASAFTSVTIRRASIVSGRFGRPLGLPLTPGLKLVDLKPPLAIFAYLCLDGWLGLSAISKACAKRRCLRNEASLKAICGRGCDACRLSTGWSIRA
jgi:hypothetical protein